MCGGAGELSYLTDGLFSIEIGFLTPPLGLNLIVAMTAFKENFLEICRSVVPFILLFFIVLIFVTFSPVTTTYFLQR